MVCFDTWLGTVVVYNNRPLMLLDSIQSWSHRMSLDMLDIDRLLGKAKYPFADLVLQLDQEMLT